MAAHQLVAARLATLGGQRHRTGTWLSRFQMRALRNAIAASMRRTNDSHASGPFPMHVRDGQYEPELYRTRRVLRHWVKVAAALVIPQEYWERCDALQKRRGGMQLFNASISGAGVSPSSSLDGEIDGRRWQPCRAHGVEQVVSQARRDMLRASLAQACANYGGCRGRDEPSVPLWCISVGEVDRHSVDQILKYSVCTPPVLTTCGASNHGAPGPLAGIDGNRRSALAHKRPGSRSAKTWPETKAGARCLTIFRCSGPEFGGGVDFRSPDAMRTV